MLLSAVLCAQKTSLFHDFMDDSLETKRGKKKRDRTIVLNEEAPDGTRLFSFRKTLLAGDKRGDEG